MQVSAVTLGERQIVIPTSWHISVLVLDCLRAKDIMVQGYNDAVFPALSLAA